MRYEDALKQVRDVLCINEEWASLDDGARHRIMWIAKLISEGSLDIESVKSAWAKVVSLPYPLRARISALFSKLV